MKTATSFVPKYLYPDKQWDSIIKMVSPSAVLIELQDTTATWSYGFTFGRPHICGGIRIENDS